MRPSFVLFVLLAGFVTANAGEPDRFRWQRLIDLPEVTSMQLVAIPLDSHFYSATRADRNDVRLLNNKSEVTGFVIHAAREKANRSVRKFWPAIQKSATVDSAGLHVEFELAASDPIPEGIRIRTSLRDFEHQVQIDSSADGTSWVPTGPPTLIFDYSQHVDARNDLLPIGRTNHRLFRLTIEKVTAYLESQVMQLRQNFENGQQADRSESTTILRRPFRLDRIEFYRDESKFDDESLRKIAYPALNFQSTEDAKMHQTVLTFETQREPITRCRIITDSQNFSRAATIEAESENGSGTKEWNTLSTATLTQFAIGAVRRDDTTFVITKTDSNRYRIRIQNGDSPPLAITNVEVSGPQYELSFLANPGQALHLVYGSADASAGQYDVAAVQAALRAGEPPTFGSMSAPIEQPDSGPVITKTARPWNDSRLLIGGLIILTVVMGIGLYRAARQIQQSPPV